MKTKLLASMLFVVVFCGTAFWTNEAFKSTRSPAARRRNEPRPQPISTASHTPPDCNPDEKRQLTHWLYDNYGRPRQFVVSTMIKSIVDCIGVTAFEFELDHIRQEKQLPKETRYSLHRSNRMPASTQDDINNYKTIAATAQGFKLASESLKSTGDGALIMTSAVGLAAGGPAGALALGAATLPIWAVLDAGGMIVDRFKENTEHAASLYASALFQGHYDSAALKQKMESARSLDEKRAVVLDELKTKAGGSTDFTNYLPDERMRALERAVDNAIYYSQDLQEELGKTKANVASLGTSLKQLYSTQKEMQSTLSTQMNNMQSSMDELTAKVDRNNRDANARINFLFDLNANKMTAAQTLYAIENFNYGNFKTSQERDQRMDELKTLAKVEQIQDVVGSLNEKMGQVQTILGNFGIQSKELSTAVQIGQKVQAAVAGYAMFMTGNYLGALTSVSSIFGGGGGGEASRHAEIMAALGTIIKLQKQTIELQIKTMEMIQELGKSMQANFQALDYHVEQVLRLQSFSLIDSFYNELVVPAAQCSDFKTRWRESYIQNLVARGEVNPDEMNSRLNIRSGESYVDYLSKIDEDFPTISSAKWKATVFAKSDFNACLDQLKKMKIELITPFKGNSGLTGGILPSKSIFSLEVGNIVNGGPDKARQIMSEEHSKIPLLKRFLSLLAKVDPNLYDKILIGAIAPSESYSGLVSKVNYLLNPNDTAQFIVDASANYLSYLRPMGDQDSTSFVNPHLLSWFLRNQRSYFNLEPFLKSETFDLNGAINPVTFPISANERDETQALVKLTNIVIAQQTLLYGDMLLVALDRYLKIPFTDQPDSAATSIAQASEQVQIGKAAFDLLNSNPYILYNFMRYKLSKAYADLPYIGFSAQYSVLNELNDPFFINERLTESGLSVIRLKPAKDKEADWYLTLHLSRGILDGDKDATMKAYQAKKDELKTALQDSTKNEEKIEKLYNELHPLKITLPKPEDFLNDNPIQSNAINALKTEKDRLLRELYYRAHLPLAPKDRGVVVLRELAAEAKYAK